MNVETNDVVKHREIHFTGPHTYDNQAQCAMRVFTDVEGIELIQVQTPNILEISYHLKFFTYATIESLLSELGFHLDNSLMLKLKRAFYQYTEDVQRENLGFLHNQNRDVFIQRYQKMRHGCQDARPEHWRDYW